MTLADLLNEPYPGYNPHDAPAISSVLATIVAGGVPPRVDVERLPDGRLLLKGYPAARVDGEITGYHVWYCCTRYGRDVPVHERRSGETYDAPAAAFSCIPNPPWNPNGPSDRWRPIYDAALATLVP